MNKKALALIVVTCFVVVLNTSLAFSLTGDDVLKRVEDAMNAPKDREADVKMTLVDKDGKTKERELKIYQKGNDKRLFRFISPPDVKGVGFLVLSDEKMYLYMPAFKKIRRIASHIKNEDFMGTDFSYDDMAESEYTDDYTAKLDLEGEDTYKLTLTPRPDSDVDYLKLRMTVDKKSFVPVRVEFFARSRRLIKVMTNSKIEKADGYFTPLHIEMKNVLKEHKTIMDMVKVKHDQGLKDKFFSQRNLKRGK